jgi:hypothetical protein
VSPTPRPPAGPLAAPPPGLGLAAGALATPPDPMSRRTVLRGLDNRIALLHRKIRAADPLGVASVAQLWGDIDRLLELRHWLQTGADPAA